MTRLANPFNTPCNQQQTGKALTGALLAKLKGKRVRVHLNLHNGCYVITHAGHVAAYARAFHLKNATPRVGMGGYRRCHQEQVRNVHAYLEGDLVSADPPRGKGPGWRSITYNCKTHGPCFFFEDDEKCWNGSEEVRAWRMKDGAGGEKCVVLVRGAGKRTRKANPAEPHQCHCTHPGGTCTCGAVDRECRHLMAELGYHDGEMPPFERHHNPRHSKVVADATDLALILVSERHAVSDHQLEGYLAERGVPRDAIQKVMRRLHIEKPPIARWSGGTVFPLVRSREPHVEPPTGMSMWGIYIDGEYRGQRPTRTEAEHDLAQMLGGRRENPRATAAALRLPEYGDGDGGGGGGGRGRGGSEFERLLRAYLEQPTARGWGELATRIIPGTMRTMWQAWARVDGRAPTMLPRGLTSRDEGAWEVYPDPFTTRRAVREALAGRVPAGWWWLKEGPAAPVPRKGNPVRLRNHTPEWHAFCRTNPEYPGCGRRPNPDYNASWRAVAALRNDGWQELSTLDFADQNGRVDRIWDDVVDILQGRRGEPTAKDVRMVLDDLIEFFSDGYGIPEGLETAEDIIYFEQDDHLIGYYGSLWYK